LSRGHYQRKAGWLGFIEQLHFNLTSGVQDNLQANAKFHSAKRLAQFFLLISWITIRGKFKGSSFCASLTRAATTPNSGNTISQLPPSPLCWIRIGPVFPGPP
jgi:hypothetical protein